MVIVFVKIDDEFDLFFKVILGAAEAVGPTELTLEVGDGGEGVLAGLGLDCYVGI